MPVGPVPLMYRDLLEGNVLAHLATVSPDSKVSSTPVWILWNNDQVQISVLGDTKKLVNMRANPYVALSLLDPENPGRYLEIRGKVASIERYDDLSLVNELSRKYTGHDYRNVKPGQVRYRVTIAIERWSGQG